MKILNLKKNQMITLLDIMIIVALIFALNSYFAGSRENFVSFQRDKLKIIATTNKSEYNKDEIVQFVFTLENKSNKDIELEFYRNIIFNLLIEKDSELVFKRDLIDSLTESRKKIIINKKSKKIFTYEWNTESNMDFIMESGKYTATLYSLDLELEMKINFIIN